MPDKPAGRLAGAAARTDESFGKTQALEERQAGLIASRDLRDAREGDVVRPSPDHVVLVRARWSLGHGRAILAPMPAGQEEIPPVEADVSAG